MVGSHRPDDGEVLPVSQWRYDSASGDVVIGGAKEFHDYTVSFLAYIMWDPVHMYNAVTNGWTNFEKQITFDVRQPKTHAYSMERLRKYIEDNPSCGRASVYHIFPSIYADF